MKKQREKLIAISSEEMLSNFQSNAKFLRLPRFCLEGLELRSVAYDFYYDSFYFRVGHGSFPEVPNGYRPEIIEPLYEVVEIPKGSCTWKLDKSVDHDGPDAWKTGCNSLFVWMGRPDQDGFRFCPSCGRRLEVVKDGMVTKVSDPIDLSKLETLEYLPDQIQDENDCVKVIN